MYVGGVSSGVEVPPEVWSGRLGLGYVGCMRDLVINGLAADLASYAKKQDSGEEDDPNHFIQLTDTSTQICYFLKK